MADFDVVFKLDLSYKTDLWPMFAQQWDYIVYLSIRNCVLIFLLLHIYYPNSYPVCLQEIHAFYEIEINDSCWQVLISFLQHNRVHLNHSWHCQAPRSSPSTGYIYQLQWSHLSVKQSLCQAYWWNLRFQSKVGQCYDLACLLYPDVAWDSLWCLKISI